MRIMEKKMETTMLYRGLYWDNGKENGNYYVMAKRSLRRSNLKRLKGSRATAQRGTMLGTAVKEHKTGCRESGSSRGCRKWRRVEVFHIACSAEVAVVLRCGFN